jgi:hypothetical protein
MAEIVARVDELLEVSPTDTRHLFWEEMKRLFYAMRKIEPADLDGQTMDDFLGAADELSNVLYRIEKQRQEHEAQRRKLPPLDKDNLAPLHASLQPL